MIPLFFLLVAQISVLERTGQVDTLTWNEHVDSFPEASVAVHVTSVVPAG